MQNFDRAYQKIVGRFEGGYSLDPSDNGGETYKGISRRFHPNWEGWKIIDLAKKMPDFPHVLDGNTGLQGLVLDFYKTEFWDHFAGDLLPYEIAEEMFDISVNCGLKTAVEFLQRSLNILNKNNTLYPDIAVDGLFGASTLNTAGACVKRGHLVLLFNLLNIFQAKHYVEIMERDHTQEKFLGWFARVDIAKL